jgi:hypothetical protein
MQVLDPSSDIDVFGDADHELLVVGTAEEGYRLWCRQCDRLGKCTYKELPVAQQCRAVLRRRGGVVCRSVERSA